MRTLSLGLALLVCTLGKGAQAAPWTEAGLDVPEAVSATGSNDTEPGYSVGYDSSFGAAKLNNSVDPVPGSVGSGYLSSGNDHDVYLFRIHNSDVNDPANQNMLRVRLTPPSGGTYAEVSLYAWDSGCGCWQQRGSMSGTASQPADVYADLSGIGLSGRDFYCVVRSWGSVDSANPYSLAVDVVASGTLSGTVSPLGVGASGAGGINITAQGQDGNNYGSSSSAGGGSFSVRVPVGVAVAQLQAQRSWFNGAPADWAYGNSVQALAPSVTLASAGQDSGGHNFDVYPEARLAGNISGLTTASWLNWQLSDPYTGQQAGGGYNLEGSGGNGSFVLHNLAPGVVMLKVQPQDLSRPPVIFRNLTFTDGKSNSQTVSFTAPASISGSLTGGSPNRVVAYLSGHLGQDAYRMADADASSGSYTLSGLPAGSYDLSANDKGPGPYSPLFNVSVGAGASLGGQDFSAPTTDSSLAGTVWDLQAVGVSNLMLLAMNSGADPGDAVAGLAPMWTGSVTAGSPPSFNLGVPSGASYDVVLLAGMGGNGWPVFHDGDYAQPDGSSGIALSTTAGNALNGSLSYQGQPISVGLGYLMQRGGSNVLVTQAGRLRAGGQVAADGSFSIPNLPDGSFNARLRAPWLQSSSPSFSVSGGAASVSVDLQPDPAQDVFKPYAYGLFPPHNSSVSACSLSFAAHLADGVLGTGVNAASVSATVDGGPVTGFTYDSASGVVSFGSNGALADGPHTASLSFSDNASPANTRVMSWIVNLSCSTPTPYAGTPTITPTQTPSQTYTETPTASFTPYAGTPTPAPVYAWTEAGIGNGECPSCGSSNNSTPSGGFGSAGGSVVNPGGASSALGLGQAWLANSGDVDVIQFRVRGSEINSAGSLDMLKVTVSFDPNSWYNANLQQWNSGCSCWNGGFGGIGGSGSQVFYRDLSAGGDQDFYLEVQYGGGNFGTGEYQIHLELVGSATISGQVQLLGLQGSDQSQVTVSAVQAGGSAWLGSANTDSAGNFYLHAPAGVAIGRLEAVRNWYNGGPVDWAYGPSEHPYNPALSLPQGFNYGGQLLKAYPEAVLSGSYSGSTNSPNNYNFAFMDEYDRRNNGGGGLNLSYNGVSYTAHNVRPGLYHLRVDANDGVSAPLVFDALAVVDGKASGANLAFNSGASLSGSISPAGSNLQVQVYEAGFSGQSNVAQASGLSSGYSFNRLAPGAYDIEVSSQGPSPYFARRNVVLSAGSNLVNITGTAQNAAISGSVSDTAGVGMANLVVGAVIHGSDPSQSGAPVLMTQPNGAGVFSVAVDSSYASWDLFLITMPSNGWPSFFDTVGGLTPGSSGVLLSSSGGPYRISGTVTVAGQPLSALSAFSGNGGLSALLLLPSGAMRGGSSLSNGRYLLGPVPNGSYNVHLGLPFLQAKDQGVSVSGADVLADVDLAVDTAKDAWAPAVDQLEPVQGQILVTGIPTLHCRLRDNALGSGINAGSLSVSLNNGAGVPLGSLSWDAANGILTVQPQASLVPGAYTATVNAQDNAGHPASVSWTFSVTAATPTISPTFSASPTLTATPSASPLVTATPTATDSPTPVGSPTASATTSPSATPTPSFTVSPLVTATPTATVSPTPTATSAYQWLESGLVVSECQSCSSGNNSSPSGAFGSSGGAVINPGGASSALGLGAGYLANGGDVDVFQFRVRASDIVNAASLNLLKVVVQSPANSYYSADLYQYYSGCSCWNGGGQGSNNGVSTFYQNLSSGTDQDFYVRVYSYNGSDPNNPYSVSIQVVASASLSGQVQLAGLQSSDASNVNVMALATGGQGMLGSASTDAAGNFSLLVPAGMAVERLSATRYWYSGGPADWAYGPSLKVFASPVSLGAGTSLSGQNFKAFPEAVLSGTYSGTSNGPNSWQVSLSDEYARGNSGGNGASGGSGNYAVHNVAPGLYHLRIDPNDGVSAPAVYDAVLLTDGKTTTRNVTFNSGASLSGSISPAGSNLDVKVYEAGFSRMGSVAQNGGFSSSYSFSRLAPGNYDIEVKGNGPSPYFMRYNVPLAAGSNTVNITGTAQNAVIAGTVSDGLGIGFANLYVVAVIHGSDPSQSVPVNFGSLDGGGNFSVPVDSAWPSWDVALITSPSNGWPAFYDGAANLAPNSGGVSLATSASGHRAGGSVSLAGQPLAAYSSAFGGGGSIAALVFRNGGLRDGSAANVTASAWASALLPDGSYTLKVNAPFALPFSQAFSLSGSDSSQPISLSLDSSLDVWAPSAGNLEPVQGQVLVQSQPTLRCRLSDGSLGTGINSGSLSVSLSNGSAVALNAPSFDPVTGDLSVLPQASLVPGSYTVTVNFSDNAGRAGSGSWTFTVTAATPTITPTFSVSPTVSATPSISATATPSSTGTASATDSVTPSRTSSPSPSATASATRSATPTATPSATASVTSSATPTATPSATASVTPSATSTATPTATRSCTPSASPTATPSFTVSPLASATVSPTATGSWTASPTPTLSGTATVTGTATSTATASATATVTGTATPTATPSATATVTGTATPTSTPSATATVTGTATPSFSATPSFTASATATVTGTATPTGTPSATATVTGTATPSATASATATATGTATVTGTGTPTGTPSATATVTGTATPSATPSATRTATASLTPSATRTATPTASPSLTATASFTDSPTATPTATVTLTSTISPTFTISNTFTASPTPQPGFDGAKAPDDKLAVANSPRHGDKLCVMHQRLPQAATLKLYNLSGERVAELTVGGGSNPCFQTEALAPGIYFIKDEATLDDGTRVERWLKVAILP